MAAQAAGGRQPLGAARPFISPLFFLPLSIIYIIYTLIDIKMCLCRFFCVRVYFCICAALFFALILSFFACFCTKSAVLCRFYIIFRNILLSFLLSFLISMQILSFSCVHLNVLHYSFCYLKLSSISKITGFRVLKLLYFSYF